MAAEVSVAREGRKNPLNAVSLVGRRALNYLSVANSKYKDASKITVETTPSGNWRLYYDDKDTGITVGRRYLNEYDLYEEGMIRMR